MTFAKPQSGSHHAAGKSSLLDPVSLALSVKFCPRQFLSRIVVVTYTNILGFLMFLVDQRASKPCPVARYGCFRVLARQQSSIDQKVGDRRRGYGMTFLVRVLIARMDP